MRLRDLAFLTDENIHGQVSRELGELGLDILTTAAADLNGATDEAVLRRATDEQRVVVTHDRDFGRLAIAQGTPSRGHRVPAPWAHRPGARRRDVLGIRLDRG